MTYTSKEQYIQALISAMARCGVSDRREILTDFEQHFADGAAAGESEEQICRKLGDPEEIAKQYASQDFFEEQPAAQASGFGSAPEDFPAHTAPPVGSGGFHINAGTVVGIVLIDILVFTWAIPTLASLIIALYSACVGLFFSGVGLFVGGIAAGIVENLGWLYTCFSPVSTALLGVVLSSGALLMTGPCVAAGRGFINVCISIVNLHSRALVGKNVLTHIGKRARA